MEFDIKPYVVKDCSSNFDNMIQQVRSVKDGVGRVRRNISINSASTANIRTSLRNSQNNMEALIEKLASLENGLDVAVDLYLSCERNILGQQNNNTNSSSGRKGLSGWWSNFKEWASTGVWDDPDKAARIKRDKAMAKELRDLLKSERFSKKTWKKKCKTECDKHTDFDSFKHTLSVACPVIVGDDRCNTIVKSKHRHEEKAL